MKLLIAFAATLSLSLGAQAQGKFGLDTPSVPIAPSDAKQPASAVLDSTGIPGATDRSPEDSPVSPIPKGIGIRSGSAVSMRLNSEVSSGSVINGDSVQGTLTAPLKTTSGTTLPAGTRVLGTVVSAAKAGTVSSAGILSLQLTHVGPIPIVTDVVAFDGKEGHKDVADSAPEKGTEAIAEAGEILDFRVLENGRVPGIIPGAKLPAGTGAGGSGNPPSPGSLPSTGKPNNAPGVNQQPINGGSSPAQNAAPATGSGR